MDEWFERLVKELIWRALVDALGELADLAEAAIEEKLQALTAGEKLSDAPLVAVVDVAEDKSWFVLVVRGRFKDVIWGASPFFRMQIKVSTDVDLHSREPLTVLEWQSVVADLQLGQKSDLVSWKAELGLGYDARTDTWLGRGALRFPEAGFGFDVLLGGLNEDGIMIGVDVYAPIPLAASGMMLIGVGGQFAWNFAPRLNGGVPKVPAAPWDAHDYVDWARSHEIDDWSPQTRARGLGVRAMVGDMASCGQVLALDPTGLTVLWPGPIFVLGGQGTLIDSRTMAVEGYAAVDVPSESVALGLNLNASAPKDPAKVKLIKARGAADAFFSFQDTSAWYVRFGTSTTPIKAKVLESLDADAFVMFGHAALPPLSEGGGARDGIFLGVGAAFGDKWKWHSIQVTARLGVRLAAGIGWNPFELEGVVAIYGELGLKIWRFSFLLVLQADVIGHVPKPAELTFDVHYSLDLPWPIPNVGGHADFSLGEATGKPDLKSPLLVGAQAL